LLLLLERVGWGKTTATASIGAALALEGKRVAVVDMDIGLRNLDVVMGLDLSLDDPGLLEPEEFWETHDAFTSHHIIKEIEMIKHKKATDIKGEEESSKQEISLGEKIMLLREIDIFSDLKVAELAAIAAVTEEVSYPPAQQIFKQEDVGETVFMVISGLVEVVRELSPEDRVVLDTISREGPLERWPFWTILPGRQPSRPWRRPGFSLFINRLSTKP